MKTFSCPSQLAPGFLLDENVFCSLACEPPRSPRFKLPRFIDGFAFSPEPTGPTAAIRSLRAPPPTHIFTFFCPRGRLEWMTSRPLWPFGSLLNRPVGALGSLREGGVKGMWQYLIPFLGSFSIYLGPSANHYQFTAALSSQVFSL